MNKKFNIVYYLGAGASALGIPVVNGFKTIPKIFLDFIHKRINEPIQPYLRNQLKIIEEEINRRQNDFQFVSSMDTLAKRIFQINGNGLEYSNYKNFLRYLFYYQHFFNSAGTDKNYGDPRYENLIRTIGEIQNSDSGKMLKVEIPNNFSFLSWNYDVLFETTLVKDKVNQSIDNNKIVKHFLGEIQDSILYDGAKLFKLNGTAFTGEILDFIHNRDNDSSIRDIEDFFFTSIAGKSFHISSTNTLKFGWETQDDGVLKGMLEKTAKKTDIVVIIGYSFPTVNRIIDRAFFDNLSKNTKVYIQGRDYTDSVRTERLLNQCFINSKPEFKTIPVESGDFFFVPAEYFETKEDELQRKRGIRALNSLR